MIGRKARGKLERQRREDEEKMWRRAEEEWRRETKRQSRNSRQPFQKAEHK